MKTIGYSIWLMPNGKPQKVLQQKINALRNKYNTPKFQPHITLLGQINQIKKTVFERCYQLSKVLKPFAVTLKEVKTGNSYFKSVYLIPKDCEDLTVANTIAKEFFSKKDRFLPHLSLIYIDTSTGVKKQIKNTLKIKQLKCEFNSIFLIKTKGTPKEWKIIREFPFKK